MVTESRLRMLRYGSPDPLPERRLLRAGPVTVILEDGGLRYIRYRGREIVRGIYAAVRDRNWGTIKPRFRTFEVNACSDAFEVRFVAEHKQEEIDFEWTGSIIGRSDGMIQFVFDGEAKSTFMKNRIGFCILHPSELAGRDVETETPDGIVQGAFPKRISPHQPFFSMQAIRHEVEPELKVELRFEGELFEMEDQRNWTDASFKSYCTPLSLPFPVEIQARARVCQQVTMRLLGKKKETAEEAAAESETPLLITVEDRSTGTVPQIGLALPPDHIPDNREAAALRLLQPSFLRATIRLNESNWRQQLDCAAANSAKLGVGLELETVGGDEAENCPLAPFVQQIAEQALPVQTVFAFPSEGYVSHRDWTVQLIALRERFGLKFQVGGGTRAYFTEMNRAKLALETLDRVMYTINPQVHAFDVFSIAETASAQADTVRSARGIVGKLPLSIGPITFKPRLNPSATSAEAARRSGDRTTHTDPRQSSLFGAGWTLGSIRYLAESGAEHVVYYETIGELGIVHRGGASVEPLYHVLAALGSLQGNAMLFSHSADSLSCEAMAVRGSDGRMTLLLANYTEAEQRVRLRAPIFFRPVLIHELDEHGLLPNETVRPRERTVNLSREEDGSIELTLQPFAFVVLEEGIGD